MVCWINLSPLCVALTRQSSGFMADWICVIKETTSKTICLSHPSVITQHSPSAAHHSKTTASHRGRERERRRSPVAVMLQRKREGGEEKKKRGMKRLGGAGVRVMGCKWNQMREWVGKDRARRDGEKNEGTDGDFLPVSVGQLWANLLTLPCCAHRL